MVLVIRSGGGPAILRGRRSHWRGIERPARLPLPGLRRRPASQRQAVVVSCQPSYRRRPVSLRLFGRYLGSTPRRYAPHQSLSVVIGHVARLNSSPPAGG